MLADQHIWCREENFIVFMYALRSTVTTLEWTTKFPRPNHAHVYFFIFPWPALYVALVYLIHRWPGEDDEDSVCANSGCHKGRFASKRRLSILKKPCKGK